MTEEVNTELWFKFKSAQLQGVLKPVCHIYFLDFQNSSRISEIYICFTNTLFGSTSPVSIYSSYKTVELDLLFQLNTKISRILHPSRNKHKFSSNNIQTSKNVICIVANLETKLLRSRSKRPTTKELLNKLQ